MSEEIKDWKGNVIKEGDEICVITTKIKDYFGKLSWWIPNGEGSFEEFVVKEKANPDIDVWQVADYFKVVLEDNRLCIKKESDGFTYMQDLSLFEFLYDSNCFVIGIKGISDTKE